MMWPLRVLTALISIGFIFFGTFKASAESSTVVTGKSPDIAFPISIRDISGNNVSPSALPAITQWIKEIENVLPDFTLPPELSVHLGAYANGAYPDDDMIDYKSSGDSLSKDLDPAFVHEFGHIIFGQPTNLGKILSSCPHISSDLEQIHQISEQVNEVISKATANEYAQLGDPSCASAQGTGRDLCLKLRALQEQGKPAQDRIDATHIEEVRPPYDEFFADLLAVLVTKQPQSMAEGTSNQHRDFSSCTPVDNVNQDPHEAFCSTRLLIWKRFVAENKSDQAAAKLLKVAYSAIGEELVRRTQNSDLFNIPNEDRDAALLVEIKKQLGK